MLSNTCTQVVSSRQYGSIVNAHVDKHSYFSSRMFHELFHRFNLFQLFRINVRGCPRRPDLGADLTGANLTDAYLIGADLTGANLPRANLPRATLTGVYLIGADLTGFAAYI